MRYPLFDGWFIFLYRVHRQSIAINNAQVVELSNMPDQEHVRLYDAEGFIGVGQLKEGTLLARRLMSKAL